MPKPIYTFLIKTQLIHAKADLRFTLQNYNKIRNAAINHGKISSCTFIVVLSYLYPSVILSYMHGGRTLHPRKGTLKTASPLALIAGIDPRSPNRK